MSSPMHTRSSYILALLLLVAACGSSNDDGTDGTETATPTYNQVIQPMLESRCDPCHTTEGAGRRDDGLEPLPCPRGPTVDDLPGSSACVRRSAALADPTRVPNQARFRGASARS